MSGPRRAGALLVALVAVLALASTGCAKKASTSGGTETSTSSSTAIEDGPPTTGGAGGSGGARITSAALTCHLAADLLSSDTNAVEVPCSAPHNQESFTLPGDELDDCYRALAASGITVGTDTFDETKPSITDDRISGHSFSTFGSGVDCEVTLDTTTTGAVIGS